MNAPRRALFRRACPGLAAGVALFHLAGCGKLEIRPVPLVETKVKIVAEDGSFTLTPGKPVPVPFTSECPRSPNPQQLGYVEGQSDYTGGAEPVKVFVPDRKEPLDGLLAFCGVWSGYHGPVASSYLIQIDDRYVRAAGREGKGTDLTPAMQTWREVVVFENYDGPTEGKKLPAWILWLSPIPKWRSYKQVKEVEGKQMNVDPKTLGPTAFHQPSVADPE